MVLTLIEAKVSVSVSVGVLLAVLVAVAPYCHYWLLVVLVLVVLVLVGQINTNSDYPLYRSSACHAYYHVKGLELSTIISKNHNDTCMYAESLSFFQRQICQISKVLWIYH